jgi:phenylacetate-CoA ligase
VICFPLGTWVGGMFTATCTRILATRGCRITTVTPGNNVDEILRVVSDLAPMFEQTVLCGYPPFLKGVVDAGRARGVPWAAFDPKLVMAGEVFSEEWRALLGERLGIGDVVSATASLYGTADAGVLGNETPLSVTIRRWLAAHPALAHERFGEARLPTLVQYDPASRYFEVVDGTLAFSGDNGAPLIRYHIADTGGRCGYSEMLDWCRSRGFDPLGALPAGSAPHELPFVWVFGRADFTVSFYGANVFPENVTIGLEQPGIKEWVTGKFVMQSVEDADRNRELRIVVELALHEVASPERVAALAASIRAHVERVNPEFANYVPADRRTPVLDLRPTGDPEWFPVGVKHRYTRAANQVR